MALGTPDFEKSCKKKCKCLTGPNRGEAYTCDDPCGGLPGIYSFDSLKCDCKSVFPKGAVRYVLDGGNVAIQGASSGISQVINSSPYFDGQGRYITFAAGMSHTWNCGNSFLQTACCSSGGLSFPCPWQGNGTTVKTAVCSGGSNNVGDIAVATYADGVIVSVSYAALIATKTSGFCDNSSFPVGYRWEWQGHFEERQQDGSWTILGNT
jgi:hypothetical protein